MLSLEFASGSPANTKTLYLHLLESILAPIHLTVFCCVSSKIFLAATSSSRSDNIRLCMLPSVRELVCNAFLKYALQVKGQFECDKGTKWCKVGSSGVN
jgi:hypothetical protein